MTGEGDVAGEGKRVRVGAACAAHSCLRIYSPQCCGEGGCVVRARSARLRLGRRNAPNAVGVRTSFGGSRWGGSAPLRSAGVHGHDVVMRVTALHT